MTPCWHPTGSSRHSLDTNTDMHGQPPVPLSLNPRMANSHLSRRVGRNLRLPSLPPYHPVNYRSPEPSRASRALKRPFSDAQQVLHQQQRELIANATRTPPCTSLGIPNGNPRPPRLHPLGSPGPVTPLMLEDQHSDYLLAGSSGVSTPSPTRLSEEGRIVVDAFIRIERERMMSRSGTSSGQPHSPIQSSGGERTG